MASWYERKVFPRMMDWAMRGLDELREETLAEAGGEVLEIGFGTGLNLRHYGGGVERLSAVDPLTALEEKVAARIAAARFPVERFALPADGRLPFDDARFDTVTMTWTLCSIGDPVSALREMRRVLRPEGRLLFIEHGRSDDAKVARWQDRLNPVHRVVACGCNLNRRIDDLVREGGFWLPAAERFTHEGPRIFAEMYRGAAAPA